MFETVAPEKFAKRSKALFYETLPVSIAVHGLVVAAALLGHIWKVEFPAQSPAMYVPYSLAEAPPPPPPPPPPPAPPKATPITQVVQKIEKPEEILAPTVIPDVIQPVTTPVVAEAGVVGGVEGGVPGGVVGGATDGVVGGEVGGITGGTLGGIVTDNRVHIERDKPLPMYPVSQVYPKYPEEARLRHWEDQVLVRYVIGTNGRVKEVTILSHAERKVFDDATVNAIKHWRFRPLMRDGQPQEVVHELTVFYKLENG